MWPIFGLRLEDLVSYVDQLTHRRTQAAILLFTFTAWIPGFPDSGGQSPIEYRAGLGLAA